MACAGAVLKKSWGPLALAALHFPGQLGDLDDLGGVGGLQGRGCVAASIISIHQRKRSSGNNSRLGACRLMGRSRDTPDWAA